MCPYLSDEASGWDENASLRSRLEECEGLLKRFQVGEARARFLAECSQSLSRSLNYEATLQTLVRLTQPYLADFSMVYGYNDRHVRAMAGAHSDPSQGPLLKEAMQLYYPRPRNPNNPVADVLRTGNSVLISEVPGTFLNLAPVRTQRLLRKLSVTSFMVVPMRMREHTVGALLLMALRPGRRYEAVDLELAEELACQAAFAAENARLYVEAQAWSAELEARVRERTGQLQQLSIHLERLREQERARIAYEVHDELGGVLTAMKLGLARLRKEFSKDAPARATQIGEMMSVIDLAVQTVRRIASDLRPAILDDLGLIPALEWQAQEFERQTGLVCHFDCFSEALELNRETSTAIFRVFQESLANIARHAQATQVNVMMLEEEGHLTLQIRDNGRGPGSGELQQLKSLGLIGMRERMRQVAGEFDIHTAPGQGTTVLIRIPRLVPQDSG
jgi:signal transduction histidine kinase